MTKEGGVICVMFGRGVAVLFSVQRRVIINLRVSPPSMCLHVFFSCTPHRSVGWADPGEAGVWFSVTSDDFRLVAIFGHLVFESTRVVSPRALYDHHRYVYLCTAAAGVGWGRWDLTCCYCQVPTPVRE